MCRACSVYVISPLVLQVSKGHQPRVVHPEFPGQILSQKFQDETAKRNKFLRIMTNPTLKTIEPAPHTPCHIPRII
jgi:hypothetical protein